MSDPLVYLDYNATTPVAREVADAMWPYLTEWFGNPSSATPQGVRARRGVDIARQQVAALIGADPDEIIFTSGGTESNNLAIRGTAALTATKSILTSAIEHPATQAPVAHLRAEHGWAAHAVPVDGDARISADDLPSRPLGLGTVILAHNEVGTIQPIAELAAAVHTAGGVMHTDAAQAVGKVPVDVGTLGVDLLSIAGHKLYAPKGVGALYIRRGTALAPVLRGAGQENGIRPGTENVASIVGLGAAAELAADMLGSELTRQSELRERLWTQLANQIASLVRVSPRDDSLPNTLMVAVPNRIGAEILEAVQDVAASTGSACHAGVHTPSEALIAMGLSADVALGALRLSLGRATTDADIMTAAAAIAAAAH
ncbi:cysteine desulfurase family protein [Cumulibacter soli]|uniref:cysteine desulfurase family protein n=1 Tax=Cumulibacter soli TaxID=2546344 RepID=UPI00106785A0|nr:cysteine desulfurase family protein [Cumulibacter soli]